MHDLSPGANAPLSSGSVTLTVSTPGAAVDIAAFLLRADGRVRGDSDMCFYNQPDVAGGAARIASSAPGETRFIFDTARLPTDVEKIALTGTLDSQTFSSISQVMVSVDGVAKMTIPTAGRSEKALILTEIYRRNGEWKVRNVSQGFNGGLAALATHFGIEVADEAPASGAPTPAAPEAGAARATINLEKRIAEVQRTAPEMVSLVKSVGLTLEKKGVGIPKAKVALVLDISGSMAGLFRSGAVDALAQRALALGLTFDDDGALDIFLFGQKVHSFGTIGAGNLRGFAQRAIHAHPLEGGTRYGDAMERVRTHYAPDFKDGLPVFVFFVTDGGTDDKPKTKRMLQDSSSEPIFWKLMGLIKPGRFAGGRTGFLEELDDLQGRVVDNAHFFNVTDPSQPSPEEFYAGVLEEFPEWIAEARAKGILR
ncbi:VWA domain-containing protein [Salipiger marinus]|uniref:Stress response protein SCP2 n=1 Tax=Salipiger marinus TaxID=555512 RepID=A0A1G8UJH1_9RHOB|nr:VWA domain-containing protein [Salipiger marinus]SDJ54026.1 Stress response protein SCP2 [Salipiger marinus]